ncbi:MAG: 5-formyltetrahydrofolate cyclo-ligase [Thermoprotei archaeon]|nr:MAG: 5-formyltetrahydrofolate cyclo-ligase [Thermoprotei archaeon]RLF23976.1 MAG: 5-formyltetrahydrofolate cyclo-ligase [Thermoprotei archaeon]
MSEQRDVKLIKKRIRERIWSLMESKNIAIFPRPVFGRIPNFKGNEVAAKKLVKSKYFDEAEVVFCCPDSPQRPVREAVLRSGKVLIMATPRLRKGFLLLKPGYVPRGMEYKASTIAGAFRYGRLVDEIPYQIDIKVTGSVAVTVEGARLGKGGGYSDLEYAILREMGVVSDETFILTTVHDVQIVNHIPMTRHDVPVDVIFTPTRVIETRGVFPKPRGIYWDELDDEKIASIPILRKLLAHRGQ